MAHAPRESTAACARAAYSGRLHIVGNDGSVRSVECKFAKPTLGISVGDSVILSPGVFYDLTIERPNGTEVQLRTWFRSDACSNGADGADEPPSLVEIAVRVLRKTSFGVLCELDEEEIFIPENLIFGAHADQFETGARARFSVPIQFAERYDASKPDPLPQSSIVEGNRMVMIIDDDDDTLEPLRLIFTQLGYRPVLAKNGKDALRRLHSDGGGLPCIIILDLRMPEMNGWEFRAAQRADPSIREIPVIVVTADVPAGRRAVSEGAAVCIPKPVVVVTLIGSVRALSAT